MLGSKASDMNIQWLKKEEISLSAYKNLFMRSTLVIRDIYWVYLQQACG